MAKSTSLLESLSSLAQVPTLRDMLPGRVTGYATYIPPVTLVDGKPAAKFVWILGPKAPNSGEMDMFLLPMELGIGSSFSPIAVVPASVVKMADIRVGDVVTATCLDKTTVRVSASGAPLELPVVDGTLATGSTSSLIRGVLSGSTLWSKHGQLLINGLPPRERPMWTWSQPPDLAHYPKDEWYLGNDPEETSVQMMRLAVGPLGRGMRSLWIGEAGSGKTSAAYNLCLAMARHNNGRPIKFVLGELGERKEDIGHFLRMLNEALYTTEGELIPGVSGIHTFFCDADYQAAPMLLVQVAQLVLGFAQRLAEECILLPEEERYSIVILLDSLSRVFNSMKFSGEGDGKTESGGEDPWAAIMAGILQLAARTGYWLHPETEERVWMDVTTIFTLLDDDGRVAQARKAAQESVINVLVDLQGPRKRDPRATLWPVVGNTLVRQQELLCPPEVMVARRRLQKQLSFTGPRGVQRDKNATVTLEKLLKTHGTAVVAEKSLVADLLLGPETENARALVRSTQITGNDLAELVQLVQELAIPRDWGPKIWAQLAKEGLVESQVYLLAKEKARKGDLASPKDLANMGEKVPPVTATALWDRLAEEGRVPTLELVATATMKRLGEDIESAEDLAKELQITRDRAVKIWDRSGSSPVGNDDGGNAFLQKAIAIVGRLGATTSPEDLAQEMRVNLAGVTAIWPKLKERGLFVNNKRLEQTRKLIKKGQFFARARDLVQALGITDDEAQDILDQLELADFATMATSAQEAGELDLNQGGIAGVLGRYFGVTFGVAKQITKELARSAKQ